MDAGEAPVFDQTPLGPFQGSGHCQLLVFARVHQRCALIECENDVSAKGMLNLHRNFSGKSVLRAVQMGRESDAIIID